MEGFKRVRSRRGPKHEFYVSVAQYEANKGLYSAVKDSPVAVPRPGSSMPASAAKEKE